MPLQHVAGTKKADIKIYALSTCPWCRKAKQFLDQHGEDYNFTDVDLLTGDERHQAMAVVKKWNPSASFPTIVIDDSRCIVGFREDELKELVK